MCTCSGTNIRNNAPLRDAVCPRDQHPVCGHSVVRDSDHRRTTCAQVPGAGHGPVGQNADPFSKFHFAPVQNLFNSFLIGGWWRVR
jgi:hypothetical protein